MTEKFIIACTLKRGSEEKAAFDAEMVRQGIGYNEPLTLIQAEALGLTSEHVSKFKENRTPGYTIAFGPNLQLTGVRKSTKKTTELAINIKVNRLIATLRMADPINLLFLKTPNGSWRKGKKDLGLKLIDNSEKAKRELIAIYNRGYGIKQNA